MVNRINGTVFFLKFYAVITIHRKFCEMATTAKKPLFFQKCMVLKFYEVKHYSYHSSFLKTNGFHAVVAISQNFLWNCNYSIDFQKNRYFKKLFHFWFVNSIRKWCMRLLTFPHRLYLWGQLFWSLFSLFLFCVLLVNHF